MAVHPGAHRVTDPLSLHQEFNMLSLPDLLRAREANHTELMLKKNVVGTAVGNYLIRVSDPWPPRVPPAKRPPRGLSNSEVRPYSWPCILVFVQKWEDESKLEWDQIVPSAIYLDGKRKVPVCVVEAPPEALAPPTVRSVVFPSYKMGGGFPVIADVQQREYLASIGCLLTDGHTTYALTNRHVTGEPDEIVYARFGGSKARIGVSSSKQLTRLAFQEVYPGWPGAQVYLHLDIGLIRIDDLNRWTAQVYGIGTVGRMADLSAENFSLRLIDQRVRAYGCASGLMRGSIRALFYRYQAMGGFEYVADFLIGARTPRQLAEDRKSPLANTLPRNSARDFVTHPGDSGTLWLLEADADDSTPANPRTEFRPIAVQWGGELFTGTNGNPQVSCALATCLSTVCNRLEVDVIRDWNLSTTEYWGEVGHYTVGAMTCTLKFPSQPGLEKLMSNNLDRVGFPVATLKDKDKVLRHTTPYEFVPLADVADDVWRLSRPNDANNHFADMDQPALTGPFKGKTLLTLCLTPSNIDPNVWINFYKGVPGTNPGALPFRVWQIYNEMVKYLLQKDAVHFLAAAGCLAHYVGDACQPLHVSRFHHGLPGATRSVEKKVHSAYESDMLNDHAPDVVTGLLSRLKNKSVKDTFSGGQGAAERVIALMRSTVQKLPPKNIVDEYNLGTNPADRVKRLWNRFKNLTMDVMADGCICLGEIWASAWKDGNGAFISPSSLGAADTKVLESYYNDKTFLQSGDLNFLAQLLTGHAAPAPVPPSAPKKKKATKKKAPARKKKR